jgi:hypothetical protein
MSLLHLEVILKGATRKADDSVTVKFETTTEMSTEQFTEIDGFRKQTGHLVFKKDAIKGSEIPKGDTDEQGQTPSQELRSALYSVWKAKTDRNMITEDWESYYSNAILGFKRAVVRSHPDND